MSEEAQQVTEQEAKEGKGHRSFDEWIDEGNSPETYVGQQAYKEKGKLLKELTQLRNQVNFQQKLLMDDLKERREAKEEDKKRRFSSLYHKYEEAKEVGDEDMMRRLEPTLNKLADELKEIETKNANPQQQQFEDFMQLPEVRDFKEKYPWFTTDEKLTGIANGIAQIVRSKGSGANMSLSDVLDGVEEEMIRQGYIKTDSVDTEEVETEEEKEEAPQIQKRASPPIASGHKSSKGRKAIHLSAEANYTLKSLQKNFPDLTAEEWISRMQKDQGLTDRDLIDLGIVTR